MQKRDIIYNDLLRLLGALTTQGISFEAYFDDLNDDDKELEIIELSEKIETETKEIDNHRNEDNIYSNFGNIINYLNNFKSSFGNFPNNRINEILLIIELISKLNESEEDINLAQVIDNEIFSLVEISKYINVKNFIHFDSDLLSNSIVLLDMSDIDDVSNYLTENSFPTELYFHLISKIGDDQFLLNNTKYVLVNTDIKDKPSMIWACLALHLIKEGKVIHEPHKYLLPPNVGTDRIISSNLDYQQFNDTIIILSEYNDQNDILDKYLRLYHVIENFMYKFPLVNLEREHNGNVFSIRDFQRIYDNLKKNEPTSVNRLIKKILSKEYSPLIPATLTTPEIPAKLFSKFVFEKICDLVNLHSVTEDNFNHILKYLRQTKNEEEYLTYNFISTNENNIAKYFSGILYAFRNSLVHNRETEFHLTHSTLLRHPVIGDTCKIILEKFLIPTIEEIVFYLLINNNDIVWYQNSTLTLFEKN